MTSGSDKVSFAATRWTIVLAAAGRQPGTAQQRALAELAQAYWFPLYAFIRRQGHGVAQAEDLAQEFFARLLEKNTLESVNRGKGKFRSFLLASLKNFLANEWDRRSAQKRGGGRATIALDGLDAEARYALEPADDLTPERLFERRWAMAVLDACLARLNKEYADRGDAATFEALKSSLTATADASAYADVAQRLGMTEGAVKVAAHRLRKRYRELLREEIAQTVASPDEVDEEIRYLLGCL
jgi:RNA polymerase sigma factor (sigma-70 family)